MEKGASIQIRGYLGTREGAPPLFSSRLRCFNTRRPLVQPQPHHRSVQKGDMNLTEEQRRRMEESRAKAHARLREKRAR